MFGKKDKAKRARIQINYKSGLSVVAEVGHFSVKSGHGGSKAYEWRNMTPNPMQLGADDIESVWEL